MANFFDQFDAQPAEPRRRPSNFFDRFDPPTRNRPPSGVDPKHPDVRHPEFEASRIQGFNPQTGMVEKDADAAAFALGGVDGVPIVGPGLSRLVEGGAALAVSPFADESFGEVREDMRNRSERIRDDNPISATAGGVTGAALGTAPMVLAAPGLFGVGAASLPVRSGVSTLAGGGIGGGDAAIRSGGDPEATTWGGVVGGITGGSGPLVGNVLGAGYRAARDAWARRGTGLSAKAVKALSDALGRDAVPVEGIPQRLADLGDDAIIADLGPNLRHQAGAIAATPGRGQEIVRSAIKTRDAGANQRIQKALADELGQARPPSAIDTELRAGQKALSPEYEAAFANARRVDTTAIADDIMSMRANVRGPAREALDRVGAMLKIEGTDQLDPHPRALHATREAIDGMLGDVTDGNVRRILGEVRRKVDDALAASVPGIKDVDAKYAGLARQREAVERGQTVLDSGRTSPWPEELAEEVAKGGDDIRLRMSQGARAEIERIVGTNANDRVALQRIIKGEGDWNRQRLATLFGQDKADRIIKVLDTEKAYADTSNIVTKNSETTARIAAREDLAGVGKPPFATREGYMAGGLSGATRSAIVRALERTGQKMGQASADATGEELAKMLTARQRDAIVRALMQANSGRPVPQSQIDAAVRSVLIGGGTAAAAP
jgi:hypothetical protein